MYKIRTEKEIKNLANTLLKKHNLMEPPISLDKILQGENIKYIEKDLGNFNLDENVDALIYKDDEIKFIAVNSRTHLYPEKKRFSIAHEIGHLFLHFSDKQKHYIAFRNGSEIENGRKEIEANNFAANLLMPDEMVQYEYFKLHYPILNTLAQKFKVSKLAMKIKLDGLHLGYIDV